MTLRVCVGPVLGVVLAGGASRRYGSDKALALLNGAPLLERVIARARPQVAELALSGTAREGFPLPVIADLVPDAGPLAALCASLAWAEQKAIPLVATFSCDAPFFPTDLVETLCAGLGDHDVAVAGLAGVIHPTFALWKMAAREKAMAAFADGTRSLHGAIAAARSTVVDFSAARDGPNDDPFFNINTPADMALAEAWVLACGAEPA